MKSCKLHNLKQKLATTWRTARENYPRVIAATTIGFALQIAWDLIWSAETTFRGMSFLGTYVNALIFALVMAIPSLLSRKIWVQVVVWVAVALWLIANLMYCRTYISWIPLESYLLVSNLGDFTASVADSMRYKDLILITIPIAGAFWLSRCYRQRATRRAKIYFFGSMGALVAVSTANALCNGGMIDHIDHLSNECYYATTPPVVYTPAGPLLAEMFEGEPVLTDEEAQQVDQWVAEQRRRDAAYPAEVRERRDNLVVIFCESFESWLIDGRVDGNVEITPYLNSLVAEETTLYAPHVRSQVGNGRSIDAQLLMLAGMYPMQRKVWSMKYPDHAYFSLPMAMKNANSDVATYLLTPDKPITWNQSLVATAFGIDNVMSRDSWEETEMVGKPAKLSDGAFLQQATAKIRNGELWREGSPTFLFFITYSGHNPFKLPDNLKGINISSSYPEKMVDYMTMANYTDRSLKPLIDYLKSRSDWDRTMVVIVGDHEGLGTYRKEWLENCNAAQVLSGETEVPLIVLNSPVAGRFDDVIGEVDVYSTILDLMSLRPYAEWPGMGQSLLNPNRVAADSPDDHASQAPKVSNSIITFDLIPKYLEKTPKN